MSTAELSSFDEPSASVEPTVTPLSALKGRMRYTGVPTQWNSAEEKERIADVLGLSTTPPKSLEDHVASARQEYTSKIVDPEELKGFQEGYAIGLKHEKKQLKKHASLAGRISRVHAQVIKVIKEDYGKQEDTNPRY